MCTHVHVLVCSLGGPWKQWAWGPEQNSDLHPRTLRVPRHLPSQWKPSRGACPSNNRSLPLLDHGPGASQPWCSSLFNLHRHTFRGRDFHSCQWNAETQQDKIPCAGLGAPRLRPCFSPTPGWQGFGSRSRRGSPLEHPRTGTPTGPLTLEEPWRRGHKDIFVGKQAGAGTVVLGMSEMVQHRHWAWWQGWNW